MRLCGLLLLVGSLLYGVESEEEALFLRRIADFWQEGEYQIAKSQIEEFILQFPESRYSDTLSAALGDLSLREKNFPNALKHYSQIQSPEFLDRVFLNRMQCLYEMEWYANLADECEAYLQKNPNLHVTYFLAIALYHQCLNASKNPEMLHQLAERAKPHFETLAKSELSDEVAQGFAHLCCIWKDFARASQIYLDLAQKNPESEEELLFQAALIQTEYDKELARQTFEKIGKLGQKRSKEATYNHLVLSFDSGHELASIPWDELPADKVATAHLLLGRSHLHRKKYPEAIQELSFYLQEAAPSDTLHAALLSLLEAAYQCNDLTALDQGIAKLTALYPEDKELPKVYFSRAQILKKTQNLPDARAQIEQLLGQFPQFEQKPQALFELAHLDYQAKSWTSCYAKARDFLSQFPHHDLSPFAWRYFVASSTELAAENPLFREQLIADLEGFLDQPLPAEEKGEWQFLLAKTHYELGHFDKAIEILQNSSQPNALLLRALCYRDGYENLATFAQLAEIAIEKGETLADPGQIHIALFNAYLHLASIEKAADHLYAAFEAKAEIKTENLLWLADVYFNRLQSDEMNSTLANQTARLLEKLCHKAALQESWGHQCKAALHFELAKVYAFLGRVDEQITLLEKLEDPDAEARLLLAEGYQKKGIATKAVRLLDDIVAASATVRSATAASAALQSARLKLTTAHPNRTEIATALKNLVIQKNLLNEPIHLEAALAYVDLQAHSDPAKKIALLQKTKNDFEQTDDLLSKDYHAARLKNQSKNQIYQGYMRLIDAEIFRERASLTQNLEEQKDLQAKAKDLLLLIIQEPTSQALVERAQTLLMNEKS